MLGVPTPGPLARRRPYARPDPAYISGQEQTGRAVHAAATPSAATCPRN